MQPKKDKDQLEAEAIARLRKATKATKARKIRAIQMKPQKDREKEKVYIAPITTQYQEQSINKNEQSIRVFFKTLKDLSDEEVANRMINFFQERVAGRYWQFNNIIKVLPSTLYKNLAEEHIKQQDSTLNIFWAKYKSNAKIDKAIRDKEKQDELDSLTAVEKVLEDPKKIPEPKKKDKIIVEPLKRKIMVTDDDGNIIEEVKPEVKPKDPKKPIKHITTISISPFENCLKDGKTSFLKNVTKTFITCMGTEEQKKQLENIIRIEDTIESRKEFDKTWYLVDDRLASVLCKTLRIWGDDFTTAILSDKRKIYFQIGYLDNNVHFFVQTKENFKEEKKYTDKLRQTRDGEIGGILSSSIKPEIEKFVRSVLSESLSHTAKDVAKYKNTEDRDGYIYKAVDMMSRSSGNSTKQLFENLANITVFLQNQSSIFAERVRDEYYLPAVLVTLSVEEKLPEVFDDPNTNTAIAAKRFISKQIQSEIRKFSELLYQKKYFTENIPSLPTSAIIPSYEIKPWKSACNNKLNADVKNSHVVYYLEDEKIYCLLIEDIYKQLKDRKHPSNPFTGNPINDNFLKRFTELYDYKFGADEHVDVDKSTKHSFVIARKPPIVVQKRKMIAPWLLDTIIKNIQNCEEELGYDEHNRCKSLEELPEDKEEDKDSVYTEDKEEDKEEDKDSVYTEDEDKDELVKGDETDEDSISTTTKDQENETHLLDDKKSLFDSDTASEPGSDASEHSPNVIEGKICQFCIKKIKKIGKCLKTIIRNKQAVDKTVYFCSFDCFEQYTCPSSKKKKQKKCGGRFASQDR